MNTTQMTNKAQAITSMRAAELPRMDEQLQQPAPMPWLYEAEAHRMIELEAYLCAEEDGFSGHPHDYWLLAEEKVGCSIA